jgi:hypothetical protein
MNEHEKRNSRCPLVAVVGDARIGPGSSIEKVAEDIGRNIVDHGFRLLTGGLGGVMEAACRGGRSSDQWCDGRIIGIVPSADPSTANSFIDIVITTGLDHGRNLLVAQADAIVAIGGGAGTLSEISIAWIHRRLIIGLRCDGWSGRLADQRIDHRIRYQSIPEDRVFGASDAEEVCELLNKYLPLYSGVHRTIPR